MAEQLQPYSELYRLLPTEEDIEPENLGAIVQAMMVIDELVKTGRRIEALLQAARK
jgi:hypothetical protein